ncbi:MAG: hypothetical protein V3W14_06715, partial [Candidatus Neomarinimicrobiota bacterium]
YQPFDPFMALPEHTEQLNGGVAVEGELGPAALAVALSGSSPGILSHRVETRDGFVASSKWELL